MYDAIIVGARCAGAPTALLLARKGYKVLLLDRGTFPSDMPFSNHYVHQTGSARLKRWGLLDTLKASNCPPILTNHFDYGAFSLTGSPVPAEGGVAEAFATGKSDRARPISEYDGSGQGLSWHRIFGTGFVRKDGPPGHRA